jgi:hypothetical protein
MKVLCVIFCGRTQMIDADGESRPEELDTHSDKIFRNNSTTLTA